MVQQIKKVNFAYSVHPTRQKVQCVLRKVEGKKGDVFIPTRTATTLPDKQKTVKSIIKPSASTKQFIRPEYCVNRQKNETRDDTFRTMRLAEREPLHSKSYLNRSQAKQKTKYQTSSTSLDESIHSESCPMRLQRKENQIQSYSSSLSSDESIHSINCPRRLQSRQQKDILRTSSEYVHSETCPMRPQTIQQKLRTYQTSYVYSEIYPMRTQKARKYLSTTTEKSVLSVSSPMRSTAKEKRESRGLTLRASERYSESRKLTLPAKAKTEIKYQTPRAKNNGNLGKTRAELIIRRNCFEDFKRMTHYLKLKQKAMEAMRKGKIFTVKGKNELAVRKVLLDRGWVEKLPPNETNIKNLQKNFKAMPSDKQERMILSSFLEKCNPNLVWDGINTYVLNGPQKWDGPIINNLEVNEFWSTKDVLCKSLQDNSWYYIENVAEIDVPRTYSNTNNEELVEFIKDYLLTACISLLRWILGNIQINKPIFKSTGSISTNIIIFAINRCKEFLFTKENLDVDKKICNKVTPGQWTFFLQKYLLIIAGKDSFQMNMDRDMLILFAYAKCLIDRIEKLRPQLNCEGCCDIWIVKPLERPRDGDVIVSSDLDTMLNVLTSTKDTYVVQKYIETPLLINKMKFAIRQCYLVTSTYPLEIWTYQDCCLKFSSQNDIVMNNCFSEPVHVTVQEPKNSLLLGLSKNNTCDSRTFKNYLKYIGKADVWDNVIYPGMKKLIVGTMLSNQDSVTYSTNRFGFYCCEFILDNDFRPWLIEVDSSPDLYPSNNTKICHRVVSDIFKVVIDHAENHKASTGKFKCVYRQPMTPPIPTCKNSANNLVIKGIGIPSPYLCKINEERETVKRECNKEENTKTLHNLEYLNDIQVKKIYKQPVLNLLQRLDSLFDLAIMKKSVNRTRAFQTQMCSDKMRKPGFEDGLDTNQGKKAFTHEIKRDSNWTILPYCDEHMDSITQTDSSLMREPENDGFGYCNLDVDRDEKTISYETETKSNPRIASNDIQRLILNNETAYKMQIEPNAKEASDDDSYKSCSYKTDKMIYPYRAQREPHRIAKSDFGDHVDVIPIYAYVHKTELV